MHKATLRFLENNLDPHKVPLARVLLDPSVENNAKDAQEKFGLPAEAWLELTKELRARNCETSRSWGRSRNSYESAVLMGFAIGWYEATHQEKEKAAP